MDRKVTSVERKAYIIGVTDGLAGPAVAGPIFTKTLRASNAYTAKANVRADLSF